MDNILDPCNPCTEMSGFSSIFSIICVVQLILPNLGLQCFPYADYLKFMLLFIIVYIVYKNGIKGRSRNCGTGALPTWSSICLSIMWASFIMVFLCVKLKGGMISNIIYIPMLFLCSCTTCCINRLLDYNGLFTPDFYTSSFINMNF